jgi:hypothetical protein
MMLPPNSPERLAQQLDRMLVSENIHALEGDHGEEVCAPGNKGAAISHDLILTVCWVSLKQ